MATDVYDIVLIGDFRFPGGTSAAVAEEIAALSSAGYRVGLLALAGKTLTATRAFHPSIAAALAAGHASALPPGQMARTRLACLHHPAAFAATPCEPLGLSAERAVLIVHHPPLDADGTAQYDIAEVMAVMQRSGLPPVVWAPVGPAVRQAFARLPDAPPLTAEDWVNVIDPSAYGGARPGRFGGVPVIGRHSRPDPAKWPATADAMRAAYPDAPDLRVALMGFRPETLPDLGEVPAGWRVSDFGAEPVPHFLKRLDFFSYFHGPVWIEAFGRAILEAMAAGLVCFLPARFEPVFGDAAIYCEPTDVAEEARRLAGDPETYARLSARAAALVAERYGPQIAVARVAARIGPPAPQPQAVPATPADKPRVLYLTSNGVGMGHLARVLALSRRHRDRVEPIIVSMSRAYHIARQEGFVAEHIPFFRATGVDEPRWQWMLRGEMLELFRFYRPRVVVLDGNVPYGGLLEALAEFPEIWSVWIRRAMWPPGKGQPFLHFEPQIDAVIEPGELAAAFDRGLTVGRRNAARVVAPITYLRSGEALAPSAARAVLGLDPSRPAVLLQFGAGNNIDTGALTGLVAGALQGPDAPQMVAATWAIGEGANDLPDGVIPLSGFPFARHLAAFDYAVAMAGYNTFHENLRAALPTLFLANEHPEQDEQWLRADFARVTGQAHAARLGNRYDILRGIAALRQPATRAALKDACRAHPFGNGADEAADYVADLAYMRRPHLTANAS
ncbi:MAG: hypothetical protein AAF914_08290 [Pseudomonadota bacterium]